MTTRTTNNLANNICVNVSDFNTFFTTKSIDLFTDLYDCPTKRSGFNGKYQYFFNKVYVSCIAACDANNYYTKLVKDEEMSRFVERAIILPAKSSKRRDSWPVSREVVEENTKEFIEYAKEIQKKAPNKITFSRDAELFYRSEYRKHHRNTGLSTETNRRHDISLKLAGIIAINDGQTEISLHHIKNAFSFVRKINKQLHHFETDKAYVENIYKYSEAIEKIRTTLIKYGANGIKHNELYAKVRSLLTNDEYVSIINIMHELQLLDKYQYRNNSAYIYAENAHTRKFDVRLVERALKEINEFC